MKRVGLLALMSLCGHGLFAQTLTLTTDHKKAKSGELVTFTISYTGGNAAALQWTVAPVQGLVLSQWSRAGIKYLTCNQSTLKCIYNDYGQGLIPDGPIATAQWLVPRNAGRYSIGLTQALGSTPDGHELPISVVAKLP
jgi:hypothetical protein